jgi:dihydroflavonol-4-reductase
VGERYILGNHNVTFREFVSLVCDVAGVKAPKLQVPSSVGKVLAHGFQAWSDLVTHREPLVTVKAAAYMQRKVWFDGGKARQELGMPRTPLMDSVERAVRYFRDAGMA